MFALAGLVASLETLPGTTLGDGALVVARRQPAALLRERTHVMTTILT